MSYLKAPTCGDEFATIPPTDRTVHGKEVDHQRKKEHNKGVVPFYQLTTDLLKISSHSSVTISPTSPASTDEKSREAG